MDVRRSYNKATAELTLMLNGALDQQGASLVGEVILSALDEPCQRILLDLQAVNELDINGLKMLWSLRQRANEVQKALDIVSPAISVARTLQLTGFAELFGLYLDAVPWDSAIVALGAYGEPLYTAALPEKLVLQGKAITPEDFSAAIAELQTQTGYEILEWTLAQQPSSHKLLLFLEGRNYPVCDGEDAEAIMEEILCRHFGEPIHCGIYLLEQGSFRRYCDRQRSCGVPESMIGVKKILSNPMDRQFFLNQIDERY